MEMRRYVRHSPAWWIVGGILALLTAGCIVLGLLAQRDSAAAEAVPIGDEIYLGDYNYIDVQCIAQEAGNFVFTAYDRGNNRIRAKCYNTTAATIYGTPAATDDLDIWIDGYGSGTRINNKIQRSSVSIGANAAATWNFPYAFPVVPYVTFSPQSPSGTITSGIWISNISSTSVTFYNNNAVSMTINAHAHGV